MPDASDRRFALAAAFTRALTPSQIESAMRLRAERGDDGVPLDAWLLREGYLTADQLEVIRGAEEPESPPSQGVTPDAVAHTPAPADPAVTLTRPSADPRPAQIGRIGRYELEEELGRGGMGVVYRAFDTELRREVALKMLPFGGKENPEMVERLLREARTAATLSHPGIVPIHDIGLIDGVPYFAMTFLRGRTLDRVLRDAPLPPLRERVRIVAAAARAVAHAHERQVIHRDLKPSNILLDPDGGVHVMDFGLAKRLDDHAGITATGQMVGTPQYMPPEQIDGERSRIGPASDVYALGAVLYECLTRKPPFAGGTVAEIVGRALSRDPESPRKADSHIHADLETICLKALDKDPRRRYPSAREFADDLDRYRNGEPIEARPVTWRTVVVRRIARQKLLAATASLAFAAAAWAGFGAWSRIDLQDKVRAGLRAQSALLLDATLTVRRAGAPLTKPEQDYLPRLLTAVAEAERVEPELAEPCFHLGRLYRALMRWDKAAEAQERALAKDPTYVPSLYERAVLTARAHGARIQALREQALRDAGGLLAASGKLAPGAAAGHEVAVPDDVALERNDDRARALRRSLLDDLNALAARGPGALADARLDCVRGLALAYGSRKAADRDEARKLLARALEREPTLEEAYEAWAQVEQDDGEIEKAIAVYDRGLQADRGYVPFWTGRGDARALWSLYQLTRGKDVGDGYPAAIGDFAKAVELDPQDASSWVRRAAARLDFALAKTLRGEDPQALFAACLDDLAKAIDLDAKNAEAWRFRAGTRTNWARWQMDRGEDPEPNFRAATEDFATALRLDPQRPEVWVWRATLRTSWARVTGDRGADPTELFQGAVADYGKAIELNPNSAQPWSGRAGVRTNWGTYRFTHGADPTELFQQAEADFRKSLELQPQSAETWEVQGLLHTSWGTFERARGGDPRARFEQALADLAHALELNPAQPDAWIRRAGVTMNWGVALMDRGEDPAKMFGESVHDFSKAIELNPRSLEAYTWRGGVRSNWGAYLMGHGADPQELFAQAVDDYAKALEINPQSAETWMNRGGVFVNLGVFRMDHEQDPTIYLDKAVADFARGLELNPRWAEGWIQSGVARLNAARWKHGAGRDPEDAYRGAADDFGRAIENNARSVDAWMDRGEVRMGWAGWKVAHGADAAELIDGADRDLTQALALAPRNAEALEARGRLRHSCERWADAIADLEAAVAANPALAGEVADRLADARVRLKGGASLGETLRLLKEGAQAIQDGRYDEALRLYEKALRDVDAAAAALADPERKRYLPAEYVANARYNLACAYALASTGQAGPKAAKQPIEPGAAGKLRDAAFEQLGRMLADGFTDFAHLREDADLEPLKADPRWGRLLERMR